MHHSQSGLMEKRKISYPNRQSNLEYLARRPVTKLVTISLTANCNYEFAESISSENCFKYVGYRGHAVAQLVEALRYNLTKSCRPKCVC